MYPSTLETQWFYLRTAKFNRLLVVWNWHVLFHLKHGFVQRNCSNTTIKWYSFPSAAFHGYCSLEWWYSSLSLPLSQTIIIDNIPSPNFIWYTAQLLEINILPFSTAPSSISILHVSYYLLTTHFEILYNFFIHKEKKNK